MRHKIMHMHTRQSIVLAVLMLIVSPLAAARPALAQPSARLAGPSFQGETSQNWVAEYYSNMYLEGNPVFVRDETTINYDWGFGSPVPGIVDTAYFSVRWRQAAYFSSGEWWFYVQADDGARLFVDNRLIIDGWNDQGLTTYRWHIWLQSGNHDIRLEYYEQTGAASVNLVWWKAHPEHIEDRSIEFMLDRAVINEGECITVSWAAEWPELGQQTHSWNLTGLAGAAPSSTPPQLFYQSLPVALSGATEECPQYSQRFSLEARFADEFNEWYDIYVTVIPSDNPYPISFTVDRTEIRPGECVNFAWSTANARSVYLNLVPMPLSGMYSDCPEISKIYRLRVVKNNWTIDVIPITVIVR